MRRRKSYNANSDLIAVFFHNQSAAADKRRADQERDRRKAKEREESSRNREAMHQQRLAQRAERKAIERFDRADELLIRYQLPKAVTPWVIEFMDVRRCDLRFVKREILEPFSSGKRSAAETIAYLAVDKDGDGTNEFEQIALLFDWYDLHDLGRPALIEYLLSTGLSTSDIESNLIKAISSQDLTSPQVYDLICTSDEAADPDPFVAQMVLDWDLGEEWVAPIVEVSRDSDMTFQDFQEKFLPALAAEAQLDAAAAQGALEAHDAIEQAARRKTWLCRWLASAVAFVGAWLLIPGGWPFALLAAVGVLLLSAILPANITGANFLWPAAAAAVGILAAPYAGDAWSLQLLAILGIVMAGTVVTRLVEPGILGPAHPKRSPKELARAAGAQIAQSSA